MPMLFASEVGCEIAEIGFSGGLHVNMVTSDFIDITGRRGKLTDRMNHLSWKKTFKIINNNIYIKIISTKYRYFFWGGGVIIACAASSNTGLYAIFKVIF